MHEVGPKLFSIKVLFRRPYRLEMEKWKESFHKDPIITNCPIPNMTGTTCAEALDGIYTMGQTVNMVVVFVLGCMHNLHISLPA